MPAMPALAHCSSWSRPRCARSRSACCSCDQARHTIRPALGASNVLTSRGPSGWLRLTCVAHREHFPLMAVGLVPVDDAAAVLRVHGEIDRAVDGAAVGYSRSLDPPEDRTELTGIDAETVMNLRKGLGPFVEVERQSVVHVNRCKRSDAGFGPRHSEQSGEKLRRSELAAGGDHEMVEVDGHRALLWTAWRCPKHVFYDH